VLKLTLPKARMFKLSVDESVGLEWLTGTIVRWERWFVVVVVVVEGVQERWD